MEETSQVATEYLLLVALSVAIMLVAVGIAVQFRKIAEVVQNRVGIERNSTVNMLVR
ncbi:hypothetical protein HY995_05310 [Candidatus Micrarchaeota archaeon]|nr:hypothetical protein [Candidatus Micrarchaeota archaeon]MBI5177473.1 hypothetical protein [Candidatus Micrarchaeota archaeon]